MPASARNKPGALTPAARRPRTTRRLSKAELTRVITHIVANTPPSRLFELYYWAQEPSLLKLMRSLASLTPASRAVLESFFQFAADRAQVTARLGAKGQLILEARHMGEAVSLLQNMADEDEPATPKPH